MRGTAEPTREELPMSDKTKKRPEPYSCRLNERKKAIIQCRCNVAAEGEPQRVGMIDTFAWLSASGFLAVPVMRYGCYGCACEHDMTLDDSGCAPGGHPPQRMFNVTHVPTGIAIFPAHEEDQAFEIMDALDAIPGWERASIKGIQDDAATKQAVVDALAKVRDARKERGHRS